jgi:predicted ferric reductase
LKAAARLPAPTSDRTRRLALPRWWGGIRPANIWLVAGGIALVILAMWLRHGGLDRGDALAAVGQLTALGGTYAALIGILLMSRAPWLDQVIGTDRLRAVHRWLGFATLWLLVTHGVTSTVAFAGGAIADAPDELIRLVRTVPGMLGAVVSLGLFLMVGVSSIRAARRRLSYETWHGLHLYTYLAVAFGFLHQLTIGTDFVDDQVARAFWVSLYVIAFGPLLLHRVLAPVYGVVRHRWVVSRVDPEGDGVYSLYVAGSNLEALPVRAGQFFVIRALRRDGWWRGHPFSLSAAPNGQELRFTVKQLGEGSRAFRDLPAGTRLVLEGPYGVLHGGRRSARRVVFVAGGIGITPLRALAESLAYGSGDADLIYRASSEDDVIFRDELRDLTATRGLRVHYVVGPRGSPGVGPDPLGRAGLRRLVPDIATRDVYVCGPVQLMEQVAANLRTLGTPAGRIHLEKFT